MTAPATDRPDSLQQDDVPRGVALIISSVALFACQDALIKHLTSDFSTAQILWVRFMLFVVFALVLATRKRPLREVLRSSRPGFQIVRSLTILADMACFVVTVSLLPLADAHSLLATFPLITTAFAALFLREAVGLRRWLAILIGFVGVLIILRPGVTVIQPGAFWALSAAGFFAAYQLMTRVISKTDDSETSLLYMALTGAVVTTIIGPFFWTWPDAEGWAWLMLLSVTGAVSHLMLIRALQYAPASVLQPFNYMLLPWALLVGFVVFGHFPDHWTLVGAVVVVGSGLYTIFRERRRRQPDVAPLTGAPPPR